MYELVATACYIVAVTGAIGVATCIYIALLNRAYKRGYR